MVENKNQTDNNKVNKTQQNDMPKNTAKKKVVMKQFTIDMSSKNLMSKGILYILLGLLFLPLLVSLFTSNPDNEISISTLVKDIRDEKISSVKVAGDELRVTYSDSTEKVALKEEGQDLVSILNAANIDLAATDLEVKSVGLGQLLWELLLSFLPVILMIGVFLFIFKA